MTTVFDETSNAVDREDAPSSGWVTEPEAASVCKRHRWDGGDVCVRCGASRASVSTQRSTGATVEIVGKARATRVGGRTGDLETLISIGWAGMGFGIQRQPFLLQEPTGRLDANGDDITVAKAVSAAWMMESAVAGKRIDRALRRTPVYKHLVRWLTPAGLVADIAPLFVAPLIVGLAAYRPETAQQFKPMLVAAMVPVLAEAARLAEQQNDLMGKLGDVNDETREMAEAFLDNILGTPKD